MLTITKNSYVLKKSLAIVIPALLIIGFLGVMEYRGQNAAKEFYKTEINSMVVDMDTWQGRSVQYVLANGFSLSFSASNENKMAVGDSVQKNLNTYLYKVFRKNFSGEYEFVSEYDYNKLVY